MWRAWVSHAADGYNIYWYLMEFYWIFMVWWAKRGNFHNFACCPHSDLFTVPLLFYCWRVFLYGILIHREQHRSTIFQCAQCRAIHVSLSVTECLSHSHGPLALVYVLPRKFKLWISSMVCIILKCLHIQFGTVECTFKHHALTAHIRHNTHTNIC